jgi:hypothetical protein
MSDIQPKNPLHGVTLEMILTDLVEHYGWEELGQTINIRCFIHEPSIKSSLKFLRLPRLTMVGQQESGNSDSRVFGGAVPPVWPCDAEAFLFSSV